MRSRSSKPWSSLVHESLGNAFGTLPTRSPERFSKPLRFWSRNESVSTPACERDGIKSLDVKTEEDRLVGRRESDAVGPVDFVRDVARIDPLLLLFRSSRSNSRSLYARWRAYVRRS